MTVCKRSAAYGKGTKRLLISACKAEQIEDNSPAFTGRCAKVSLNPQVKTCGYENKALSG